MRAQFLLFLLSLLSSTLTEFVAASSILGESTEKTIFNNQKPFLGVSGEEFSDPASEWLDDAKKAILRGKKNLEKWYHDGREYVKQDNLLYEFVTHPSFESYSLRVTEPSLCDLSVKQYSGYLDIAEDKHLFFWFFESRTNPADAPLILWLNGGPGCSSSTGLLFELSPCSIINDGLNVTSNPYSWNKNVNIIFLDQPVNVGFSYSDNGTTVSNTPVAAKDVYAFLEIFLNRFSKYSKAPFHLAAESYGGTFAPKIADVIHQANQQLQVAPNPNLKIKHINLASVIIGNGLTDAYTQMASIPDWACEGPYPVYDDPHGLECKSLRAKVPICQGLIKTCYTFNSRYACAPALLYCNEALFGQLSKLPLNPYDVRVPCSDEDRPLCYKQLKWVETWMNSSSHKAQLGVDPLRPFEACNMEVHQAFILNGEGAYNSASLLPELVDAGIRLLVYSGNTDMVCNFIGGGRWVERLETKFSEEYRRSPSMPWVTTETGRKAGEVRSAGFGAGNVTFVTVYEAGHMVPFDQPEAALDMITRWIEGTPLSAH